MRRLRDALTLLILFLCLAICAAAAVEISRHGRSAFIDDANRAADRTDPRAELLDELRRVMVEGSLADLPREDQQRFVERVDRQFTVPEDWRQQLGALSDRERQRFEENLETLARLWLKRKVDRYFNLPAAEQIAFLDEEIRRGLELADRAGTYDGGQPGTAGDRFRSFGRYYQRIREAFENAPRGERQRMALFLYALQARWNNHWRDAPPIRDDD